MSSDFIVYLQRSRMPSPAAWQAAIVETGFPVLLDTDFDVDSFSGFLPCRVNGEMSGFHYCARQVPSEDVRELELAPDTDFLVLFCFGSRTLELASALAALSALVTLSGGQLHDPHTYEIVLPSNVISWAKAQLTQADAE